MIGCRYHRPVGVGVGEDVEVAGTVKVHTGFRNSLDSISVTVVAEC